ncbi:hypothetical protein MPER_04490, partial [Moniliophthora perniciosa FA553]
DVDENVTSGKSTEDPKLAKDVSKFLKGLNFDNPLVEAPKQSDKQSKKEKKDRKKADRTTSREDEKQASVECPVKERKGKKGKKDKSGREDTTAESSKAEPTIEDAPEPEKPKVELPKQVTFDSNSSFAFHPTPHWYTAAPGLKSSSKPIPTATSSQLQSFMSKAAELHAADIHTFKSSTNSSSHTEASFLSKIIQSGTLSDRLSALTLLVQSSPVHNVRALEALKGMAERGKGKGGREESLKALRCM